MNNNMQPIIKTTTKIPFFRRAVLQNFPFIEKDFDALTDYELLCKVVEYLNEVIKQTNLMEDNGNELVRVYNELYNYVEHYFNNLDVQEEINNKLDEMAQDGTLDQIIEQYLNSSAIWGFDTVSDMKNATNLINGSYAKTLGYHSVDDGGGALYHITNTQTDEYQEELESGLYATLIIENNDINVKQFGAYGDGTHDDTTSIQLAINTLRNKVIDIGDINGIQTLYFIRGNYKITSTLILSPLVKISTIGFVVISSYVSSGSSLWLRPETNDIIDGTLSKVRDWYQGNYINGTDGFVLKNMSNQNVIGLEIGLRGQVDVLKGFMLAKIFGMSINDFKVGLKLNPINLYCCYFEKLTLAGSIANDDVSIQVGDENLTTSINSGERISFTDCQLGSIKVYAPININFIRCSFDFTNYVIYSPNNTGYSNMIFDCCWFEGMSYLRTDIEITNGLPYGIISQKFIYSYFKFLNSTFVMTNMKKLFVCSEQTSISYYLILENINVINASVGNTNSEVYNPANTYFCNDLVNVYAKNVNNVLNKRGNFVSRKLNYYDNPNFNSAEVGTFNLSTGGYISTYKIVGFTGFNLEASVITNEINNKKSIKLVQSAETSAIRLLSEKINCNKGDIIQANAWFKGFTSINITINFYDYDGNLISSTDNYVENPTHDNNIYYLNPYNKIEPIPARCKSFDVEYRFNVTNGNVDDECIIGEMLLQIN